MLKEVIESQYSSGMIAPGLVPQSKLKEWGMPLHVNARVEFSPQAVMKLEAAARKRVLKRTGAYVRKVVQNLIRKRKKKAAPPGHAPFYHGHRGPGGLTFKQSILFEADSYSVAIGPQDNRWKDFGGLHEFGGTRSRKLLNPKKMERRYRIGEVGPVSTGKFKRQRRNIGGNFRGFTDPLDGSPVVFIRLTSKRQIEHARRLNRRMQKQYFSQNGMAKYPARPFMGPGFQLAKPKFAEFWRDAIR